MTGVRVCGVGVATAGLCTRDTTDTTNREEIIRKVG